MPTKIIGTAPYQVPRNSDLGSLAVQDLDNVNIQGGAVTLGAATTQGYFQNTDVSEVKPSLLLDFANGKTLDPRITFSRASTAMYYDGKTIAVAEQNLLTYSQDFNLGGYTIVATSVIPNAAVAPDNSVTAEILVEDSTTDVHRIEKGVTTVPGLTYTFSIYAKALSRNWIYLDFVNYGVNSYRAWFNLSTGVLGSVSDASITSSITNAGNGWYRCSMTRTAASGQTNSGVVIASTSGDGAITIAGNSLPATQIWGAQVEQRSAPSAYVPTTSYPITNYVPALQTAGIGVARFDHDAITGESYGLLIEEQRTNLALYSSAFGSWTLNTVSILSDNTIAPDGNMTADKLVADTTSNPHYIYQSVTTGATTTTYSVYAKYGGARYLYIDCYKTSAPGCYFDILNGLVSTPAGTVSSSIQSVGNGWYRCSITFNAEAGSSQIRLFSAITTSQVTYTGNGYDGLYIWGAQLEAGDFATTYIPTSSSQVTRGGDFPVISGINFSSWFNNQEGTVVCASRSTDSYAYVYSISDGTGNNRIDLYRSGGVFTNYTSGKGFANYGPALSPTSNGYCALAYTVNDYVLVNPSGISAVAIPGVPVADRLWLGLSADGSTTSALNGTIKKIAFYPKRLSNAELAEITL